jgi:hypothetical protein
VHRAQYLSSCWSLVVKLIDGQSGTSVRKAAQEKAPSSHQLFHRANAMAGERGLPLVDRIDAAGPLAIP